MIDTAFIIIIKLKYGKLTDSKSNLYNTFKDLKIT